MPDAERTSRVADATLIIRFATPEQQKCPSPKIEGSLQTVDSAGKIEEHKVLMVEDNDAHEQTVIYLGLDLPAGTKIEKPLKYQPTGMAPGVYYRVDPKDQLRSLLFARDYEFPEDLSQPKEGYPRWGMGSLIGITTEGVGQTIIVDHLYNKDEVGNLKESGREKS